MTLSTTTELMPLQIDADGVMRVGGTRVTLDTVIVIFEQGATAEEIVQRFPTLDLADVYFAIGYYLRHRAEVDNYLAQRQQLSDHVRAENTARFNQHGLRERLLARRVVS
ncbi:MAG: DUF433 domain-containing protein [Roseiflexaceae bacterium]